MGTTVGQAQCGGAWMIWNDFEETHRRQSNRIAQTSWAACTRRENLCVAWYMRAVRCTVRSFQASQSSLRGRAMFLQMHFDTNKRSGLFPATLFNLAATARNRRASLSSIAAPSIIIGLVADTLSCTRGVDTDLHFFQLQLRADPLCVSLIWLVLQSCSCPTDDSTENSDFFRLSCTLPPSDLNLSMVLFRQSVSAPIEQERTIVLFDHDRTRGSKGVSSWTHW